MLAAAACDDPDPPAAGGLSVSPTVVNFGEVVVGLLARRALILENRTPDIVRLIEARPDDPIAGAIRLAKQMGPGHTIVTILCDYGTRYQSKLFNPEFLRSKNLPVPGWLERDGGLKDVLTKVMA